MKKYLPNFLQKFDQYLLTHFPDFWSTQLHWVIIGSIPITLFIGFISTLDVSGLEFYIGFISLISFIFWITRLLRFNYFKQFGRIHFFHALVQFLCFFCTVSIFTLWIVTPTLVKYFKYNMHTVQKDVDRMNELYCILERDSLPKEWPLNKIIIYTHNSNYYKRERSKIINGEEIPIEYATYGYKRYEKDSLQKIDDSTFYMYSNNIYSAYTFNKNGYEYRYGEGENNDWQINSNKRSALFQKYIVERQVPNKPNSVFTSELENYFTKYQIEDEELWGYDDYSKSLGNRLNWKYHGREANDVFARIAQSHSEIANILSTVVFYPWYIVSVFLALCIFIYRHCTRKVFIWTWVGYAIMTIFNLFASILFRDGMVFLYLGFVYIVMYFIGVLVMLFARKANFISLLCLNYFTFCIPTLPAQLMFEKNSNWFFDQHGAHSLQMVLIGFVLLLISLVGAIGPLYKSFYAMPSR